MFGKHEYKVYPNTPATAADPAVLKAIVSSFDDEALDRLADDLDLCRFTGILTDRLARVLDAAVPGLAGDRTAKSETWPGAY